MAPPVPRGWLGLAFFVSFLGVFLIRRFSPGVVTALAGSLPERAALPVLALVLMLIGVVVQAAWWGAYRLVNLRRRV